MMLKISTACVGAALMVATWAQQPQTVDVTAGPQVGQRAIAFRLPDQLGREQTLATVAGQKGTMLVFFRSSDW